MIIGIKFSQRILKHLMYGEDSILYIVIMKVVEGYDTNMPVYKENSQVASSNDPIERGKEGERIYYLRLFYVSFSVPQGTLMD